MNWSAPWLALFAEVGQKVAASSDWRRSLNQAAASADLRNSSGKRIEFCEPKPGAREAYESGIARTGCVPMRADLHDFFNALTFLHFPTAKASLNRLQAAEIARNGVRAMRGSVRDAATLIDENAVLVVTERADIVQSLRSHDWQMLFQGNRTAWTREVDAVAFGHALLQKLTHPYNAITAHALHIPLPPGSPLPQIDRCMAAALDENLSPNALLPLPVLGIPGWCVRNENPDFYSDRTVFRPAKMRRDRKEKDS
ncbi:MAG TPA: DUF3025 domain-containing protein [Burkholderiaceae bacterium]|nr:DUF3025 domain-containing protein [Burkholderiaceae bacterium]